MEEFSDMTAEDDDDDIKGGTFPSVVKATDERERKALDVKEKRNPKSPVKVTEAIAQPEHTDRSTQVNVDALQDSEMGKERKLEGPVEKTTQTTTTAGECEDAEPASHVTPSQPKSPTALHLTTTLVNTDNLQQDSSGDGTPEKAEVSLISGAKRRLDVDESSSASPEKSPRLMTPSPSPPQPFRALCKPNTETAQQKVPPLKVIIMCWKLCR